jgi:hypothetical protein
MRSGRTALQDISVVLNEVGEWGGEGGQEIYFRILYLLCAEFNA